MKASEILLGQIKHLLRKNPHPLSLTKDKVKYRRAHVTKLILEGSKHIEIASIMNCSLSTIEKDVHAIREGKYKNE